LSEPTEPETTGAPADVLDAVTHLQNELDALLGTRDTDAAVRSLDTAVASLKDVEHRNVASVQLVALD
jgi:hypothetical protein